MDTETVEVLAVALVRAARAGDRRAAGRVLALADALDDEPAEIFRDPPADEDQTMPGYVPAYPHGLPNPYSGQDVPGEAQLGWTPAPDTSHCYAFRYYDARDPRWKLPWGASQLQVMFRQKDRSPTRPYVYFFGVPQDGERVFADMENSPHPYGEVLYPRVIEPAVIPYTRL